MASIFCACSMALPAKEVGKLGEGLQRGNEDEVSTWPNEIPSGTTEGKVIKMILITNQNEVRVVILICERASK